MIEKHASAIWKGTLKDGGGTITTQSGALSGLPYTFATRFEDKRGANPEELIGAAHAACYSMFLSALMSGEGITAERIETTSTVSLDPGTEVVVERALEHLMTGRTVIVVAHRLSTVRRADRIAVVDLTALSRRLP